MRMRAVYNARFGQWKICHDKWCRRGETSVVATILTGDDPKEDQRLAEQLAERWNMVEDARS